MLTGNIVNIVPSLEEEMTAVVTLKMPKRQRLTNNDCGDAISKFAKKSAGFYSSFSTYVENRAKADNRSFAILIAAPKTRLVNGESALGEFGS